MSTRPTHLKVCPFIRNLFVSDEDILSRMLGEKISAPSRLLLTDDSFATVAVGFPDLDKSTNDLYCWFRQEPRRRSLNLMGKSVILNGSSQVMKEI